MPELDKETRANLQYVRDAIAALEEKQFKMSAWGCVNEMRETQHTCGSAGCIGGWAEALLFERGDKEYGKGYVSEYEVGAKLGLNEEETDNLFYLMNPQNGRVLDSYDSFNIFDVKQSQAVKMLDHLLAGGEVDWNVVMLPRPVTK